MKRGTSLLLMLCSLSAWADLGIDYADRSSAVIFRDADTVYFEYCTAHAPHPRRGCSGKDLSGIYSATRDVYWRGVESFYGLVNREYAGAEGATNLDAKIGDLKEHLDREELTVEETKRAEALLRQLVSLKDQADRADRDVLRYLDPDTHAVFSEEFQSERTTIAQIAFYGVAYLKDQQLMYRVSEPTTWDRRDAKCAEFGSAWTSADAGSELRRTLSLTALAGAGETVQVWSGSARGGGCQLTCGQYGNSYVPESFTRYGSCEGFRREQQYYSYIGAGGLCQHNHGLASGQYSIDFIPRTAAVSAFGASFDESEETIEASEGSPADVSHPTLCRKSFRLQHDDSDRGYLNEPHFASFALPELESSLSRLAQSVYANRAAFFREIAHAVGEYPSDQPARLFVLQALDPILHDIHSRFVDRYVVPDYESAKELWSHRLNLGTLAAVPLTPAVYHEAMVLLHAALQASDPSLTTEDRRAAQELTLAIGQAMAEGPTSRAKVVDALKQKKPLLDRLVAGARTLGFGTMMLSIETYLEKK